jgi:integrase
MPGIHKLTARKVETARRNPELRSDKSATLLPDGGSLYLRITKSGRKTWVFRYREHGGLRTLREMGLGAYPAVGLGEARTRAGALRKQHQDRADPLAHRRAAEARHQQVPTFEERAAEYIEWRKALPPTAKSPKRLAGSSLREWETTLRLHVLPGLGPLPIDQIDGDDVAEALGDVWRANASANRILNRVEQVFERAVARELRADNPARWALQKHILGPAGEGGTGHAALPWREVPAFMARLRADDSVAARAIEFAILTAARTGEVIGSRGRGKPPLTWAEIDAAGPAGPAGAPAMWTVPATRMKARAEHWVPLSRAALALLARLAADCGEVGGEVFRFPTRYDSVLADQLDRLGVTVPQRDADGMLQHVPITMHGFRASFKSWAEENGFGSDPRLIEFALAHKLPDRVEAAYSRVTRVEERRAVMERWGRFCEGAEAPEGNVILLAAAPRPAA